MTETKEPGWRHVAGGIGVLFVGWLILKTFCVVGGWLLDFNLPMSPQNVPVAQPKQIVKSVEPERVKTEEQIRRERSEAHYSSERRQKENIQRMTDAINKKLSE